MAFIGKRKMTATAVHPMKRMGDVQGIDQAMRSIASPDINFLTGTNLTGDRGYCCKSRRVAAAWAR